MFEGCGGDPIALGDTDLSHMSDAADAELGTLMCSPSGRKC